MNPIVTLPLHTCLVTQDAQALAVQLLPECTLGETAKLIVYKDTMCAEIDSRIWTNNSTCIAYSPSRSVPAVMFACGAHAGDQPQATITSTVAATYTTAPVATAVSLSRGSTESPMGSTSTSLITSATPSSSTPPTSSQASSSGASGNYNSNLSRSGQIALGVVLPLGAIGVALLAWLCPKPWTESKQGGKQPGLRKFQDTYG